MGRARGKGSGARKAKKAANDREETKKFFNQGGLGPPPKETRRARAAPAEPKLDQFARKRFDKDDKKHTAVVDAAIAAEDRSLPSDAALEAMTGHQLRKLMARRGVGRDPQDRKEDFIDKLKAHAAGETYKKTPWWYGITDILKAPDEELLKFVKRKGDVIIVKSCCGKVVVYGEDSGLRRRSCIAFSVEEYGLDGATRRARLETFKTLGLRDTKFLEQLQKLTPKKDRDDVLADIKARKESGGAVERIAGGAGKNVDTGMHLVQHGDKWMIAVQYYDGDGRYLHKLFDDTPEGAEKAEEFVFKHAPGAVRRDDLMENTVADENDEEMPHKREDAGRVWRGEVLPRERAPGRGARLRGRRPLFENGGDDDASPVPMDDGDGAAPLPRRAARGRGKKARVAEEANEPFGDEDDDAPAFEDDDDAPTTAAWPGEKRDHGGGAVGGGAARPKTHLARRLEADAKYAKYYRSLTKTQRQPQQKELKGVLEDLSRFHRETCQELGMDIADDWSLIVPTERCYFLGSSDAVPEFVSIYYATERVHEDPVERLKLINERVFESDLGRQLLSAAYDCEVPAGDAYDELQESWCVDTMGNAHEFLLESMVLRPTELKLRWKTEDGFILRDTEVKRFYGHQRFMKVVQKFDALLQDKKNSERSGW